MSDNNVNESGGSTTGSPAASADAKPRVFIFIKRNKEDPGVPRMEVVDSKNGEDEWEVKCEPGKPEDVRDGIDCLIFMREFVHFSKLWKSSNMHKFMPITEYIIDASSGFKPVQWPIP